MGWGWGLVRYTVNGAMEGMPRSMVVLGGSYMPGTVPLSLTWLEGEDAT